MVAIVNQPTNTNFLSPMGFRLTIKKTPNMNYFVQSVNIPSVSLGGEPVDTPFSRIPIPGTRLTFGQLRVTFKVDEDLGNYKEIYTWLNEIGFPDNFAQYGNISQYPIQTGEGVYSDVNLTLMTSAMNANYNITFRDAYPVDLSDITLDSTATSVDYVTATATFVYRKFDLLDV